MDMLSLVPLALSAAPLYLSALSLLYSTLLYSTLLFLSRSLSLRPSLCLSVFRSLALALYLPSLSHSRSLLLHPPRSPMLPSFLPSFACMPLCMYVRVWLSLTGDMSSVRVSPQLLYVCVYARV